MGLCTAPSRRAPLPRTGKLSSATNAEFLAYRDGQGRAPRVSPPIVQCTILAVVGGSLEPLTATGEAGSATATSDGDRRRRRATGEAESATATSDGDGDEGDDRAPHFAGQKHPSRQGSRTKNANTERRMMSHLPSASVRGQDDMRPKTSALANRGVERARSGGAQVAMWFSVGSEDTGWVVRARGDYRDRTMENHRGRRRHGRVCTELGGACCPWLCPFLVRLRIPCSQLLVDVRHPPIVVVGPQQFSHRST
jgi:hypothetical protein